MVTIWTHNDDIYHCKYPIFIFQGSPLSVLPNLNFRWKAGGLLKLLVLAIHRNITYYFDALYNLNGIWHIPKMIAAYVIICLFMRNCSGYHSTHILWKYHPVSRDLKAIKIRNFEIQDKRKTLISAYKTTFHISKSVSYTHLTLPTILLV